MAALAAYNFTLNYRPGKINVGAEALSRIPWDRHQTVDPGTVGHLLGTVITKVGCVIECYIWHTATMPEPVPKMEPSKNVCDRLDGSPKRGRGYKKSH